MVEKMLADVLREIVGRKFEQRLLRIADFSTLKQLISGRRVKEVYEAERRYEPARLLSEEDLEELSGGKSFYIIQAYGDAVDERGEKKTFRYRITQENDEPPLLRIAYKERDPRAEGAPARLGKKECQIILKERYGRTKEFDTLLKNRKWSRLLYKTRYYIPFVLPNGNTAEIHYDIHHGPPEELDGHVRIEIELHGKPGDTTGDSVEADAAFLATREGRATIPKWIGEDVTGRPEYKSKALAEYGSVEKARAALGKKAEQE